MSYQNYEEYMRSVLGYSPYVPVNDYTYSEQEDIYDYSNTMNVRSFTRFNTFLSRNI